MANIRDIATGVRESARFYVELHKLGVNIQCFDVGGGLGVDYEGTRSQSDCSVNYGLNEYANNIIWAIGDACEENGLPHPTVITESGRAVTAHHTVLVSNIIGVERNEYTEATPPAEDAARPLQSMWETWQEMHETGNRRSLREWLHDSQMDLHDIHIGYSSGTFNLQERAWAEQLYLNMCHEVQKQLDPSNRAHRPIIDELQERMADKIYVNFSLFQSMPDVGYRSAVPGDAAGRAEHGAGTPRGAAGYHLRLRWRDRPLRGWRRDRHHHADAGIRSGEPADAGLLYGWRLSGDPRQHAQPVRRYRSGGRVRLP
jgi:arginine decarboxylase